MRRAALVTGALIVAIAVTLVGGRWSTREREYVAVTPQPATVGIPTSVVVPPDGRTCMNLVALDEHSEEVRIRPATVGPRPEPLTLTLAAQGYRVEGAVRANYEDREPVRVPVRAPDRSLVATACVQNRGDRDVYLLGVNDRSRSRGAVHVDGRPAPASFVLEVYERAPASIADRLPESMRRMSVLRPAVVGPTVLWPLLLLFVVGVPAVALLSYSRALREDDE